MGDSHVALDGRIAARQRYSAKPVVAHEGDTARNCDRAGTGAIVCNRIVSTLGPQLDTGGFLSRPLCHDSPFAFLLWPQDSTWTRWSPAEYALPLRRRITVVLFHMLWEASQTLWPQGSGAPPLCELLPRLTLMHQMPGRIPSIH